MYWSCPFLLLSFAALHHWKLVSFQGWIRFHILLNFPTSTIYFHSWREIVSFSDHIIYGQGHLSYLLPLVIFSKHRFITKISNNALNCIFDILKCKLQRASSKKKGCISRTTLLTWDVLSSTTRYIMERSTCQIYFLEVVNYHHYPAYVFPGRFAFRPAFTIIPFFS